MQPSNSGFGTFATSANNVPTSSFGAVTSSSIFGGNSGQPSGFGAQPVFGSQASSSAPMFGSPPSGTGSSSGSQSTGIFGSSSGGGNFGSSSGTPSFGATTQSTQGISQSSPFSRGTQPASVFGSVGTFSQSSTFGTASVSQTNTGLFGMQQSSNSGPIFGAASSTSVGSGQSSLSSGSSTMSSSQNLFMPQTSRTGTNSSSVFGAQSGFGASSKTSASTLFGKPSGSSVFSSTSSNTNPFNTATSAKGGTLFGKPVQTSDQSAKEPPPYQHKLFDKPGKSPKAFFGKTDTSGSNTEMAETRSEQGSAVSTKETFKPKALFGKGEGSSNASPPSSQGFGQSEKPARSLFGKEVSSSNSLPRISSSYDLKSQSNRPAKGLFGKDSPSKLLFPVSSHASSKPAFERRQEPREKPTENLFGKGQREDFGEKHAEENLFRKGPSSKPVFPVLDSASSASSVKEQSTTSVQYGQWATDTDQASKPSDSRGLFGKKPPQDSGAVEKTSKMQDASGPTGRESPQKPKRKWSRNRDTGQIERQKRDFSSPPNDSQAPDTKRVRGEETEEEQGEVRPQSRLRLSTRQSVEDLSSRTSLIIKELPASLNQGSILRKHFSQFGQVIRVLPVPSKGYANITFQTHEEAAAAKARGKHIAKGRPPLAIFWRSANPGLKSPEVNKPLKISPRSREEQSSKTQRTGPRSALEDELASMSGTADVQEEYGTEGYETQAVESSTRVLREKAGLSRRRSPTPPPAPSPVVVSSASGSDKETIKSLFKELHSGRAQDTAGKIALLDARDKLLKLLRGRQHSDLSSAKAFVGNCPDMCPEKERYYREDIRRLALYEVIPETLSSLTGLKSEVDHYRAVKEYSRSSADQEEPLPHELRPLPVLVSTMHYLLSEVGDRGGEGKWAEWYDFLWNRTRGIRKDITQQQLCAVQVAELLEKCARFHIFSSEHLCEEDMMSFDTKINNENLTKCLQTLKELYADLETKHGVYCPNEAEFRAYMVLMNLNEGDILREVQQLRPELRESPYIGFAVKAYNALNSCNYVRFFRLLDQATFLNACICHRYFNQIRSRALLIILKAHGASGKIKIMYPLSDLVRLLRFEDEGEAEEFCYHYCLTVENGEVVLDQRAYLEPESSLPMRRSQTLVEAKRTGSVGETINGGPLPPLQLHKPFSSFDENGRFIMPQDLRKVLASGGVRVPSGGMEVPAQALFTGQQTQREAAPQPQREMPSQRELQQAEQHQQQLSRQEILDRHEAIKSTARTLIIEVIDELLPQISGEVVMAEIEREAIIATVVDEMVETTSTELFKSLATEVHEEEEALLRKAIAEEMEAQKQRVTLALAHDIEEEGVKEMTKKVAEEEMSIVKAELHRQCVSHVSDLCSKELLDLVGSHMIQDVAQEVYEVDVVAKRERLEETERLIQQEKCRSVFQFWKKKYLAHVRVKRAMLDFPSAPPARALGEQLKRLVPDQADNRIEDKAFYISDRARLSLETPMEVVQQQLHLTAQLSMASVRQMLASLRIWRPLDLVETFGQQLYREVQVWKETDLVESDLNSLPWKLVLSVPSKKLLKSEAEPRFVDWLRAKLCKDSNRDKMLEETPAFQGEVLSCYHSSVDQDSTYQSLTVSLCVRCVHGVWTDNQEIAAVKENVLKGTTALLFVTSHVGELMENETAWKKNHQRLQQMLKQKPKSPGVPVVIVLPRLREDVCFSAADVQAKLGLTELYDEGFITSAHLAQPYIASKRLEQMCEQEWVSQLTNCLRFLATNVPAPPRLRVKPVADYVEDAVVEFYKAPVYQDLRTRTRKQLLHQSPNKLLSLYNEVIEHLAMTCASSTLTELSWPPPEFDQTSNTGHPLSSWNSESHLCNMYELVAKMRLPTFRYGDLEAEDWAAVCKDVWAFVNSITKKDSGSAKIGLFHQVQELLCRCKKQFDQFCWLASEDGPCEPTYINMVWTDLIDACIHYKLVALRTGHIAIRKETDDDDEEQKVEEFEETLVYYWEDELSDWEAPGSWLDALRDTETAEPGQVKPTVVEAASKLEDSTMKSFANNNASKTNERTKLSHTTLVDEEDRTPSTWEIMKNRLEQERNAVVSFEAMLSNALSPTDTVSHDALRLFPSDADILSPLVNSQPLSAIRKQGSERLGDLRRSQTASGVYSNTAGSASERKLGATDNGGHSINPQDFQTPNRKSLQTQVLRPAQAQPQTVHNFEENSLTLSERVSNLEDLLEEQRRADKLFEMKLERLMYTNDL